MTMSDYFTNHARVRQFPWSLYHGPLEDDLAQFLQAVADAKPEARVLVIGCGTMAELDRLPASVRCTVVDVDARAVEAVRARQDPRIERCAVVDAKGGLRALGTLFDAIYAKEVIEHIVEWRRYFDELRGALAPGGQVWLSTPNYGEPWLAAIEGTFLEAVARLNGFTRRGMHPSRFSRRSLEQGLRAAKFDGVHVSRKALHLALVAHAAAPR